jgi:hypothetical protein
LKYGMLLPDCHAHRIAYSHRDEHADYIDDQVIPIVIDTSTVADMDCT